MGKGAESSHRATSTPGAASTDSAAGVKIGPSASPRSTGEWPHNAALLLVAEVAIKASRIGSEAEADGERLTLQQAVDLATEQADYTDKQREAIWAALLLSAQSVTAVSWRVIQKITRPDPLT